MIGFFFSSAAGAVGTGGVIDFLATGEADLELSFFMAGFLSLFNKILEYSKKDSIIRHNKNSFAKLEQDINNLENIKLNDKEEKGKSLLKRLISTKDTIKQFQITWHKKPLKLTIKDLKKIKFEPSKKNNDLLNEEDYVLINTNFNPTLLKSENKKHELKNKDILYFTNGKISTVNNVNELSLENKYITWFDKAENYSLTLITQQNKVQNLEALIEYLGGKEIIVTQSNILPHDSINNNVLNNKLLNESLEALEIELEEIKNLDKKIKSKKTELSQLNKEIENLISNNPEPLAEIYGGKKVEPNTEISAIIQKAFEINNNQSKLLPKIKEFRSLLKSFSLASKTISVNKAITSLENQLGIFL